MRIPNSRFRGKGFTLQAASGKPLRSSVLYKFASGTTSVEGLQFLRDVVRAKRFPN